MKRIISATEQGLQKFFPADRSSPMNRNGTGQRYTFHNVIWRAFQAAGLSRRDIALQAGLSAEVATGQMVTCRQFFAIWDAISSLSGELGIGFRVGKMAGEPSDNPAVYALLPAPFASAIHAGNFVEAAQRIARIKSLCAPEDMCVEDPGDRVVVSLKPHCIGETGPDIPDSLVDASFYAMLLLLRRGTGRECNPRAVALRRTTGNEKFYEGYYGCPVTCSAPLDVITFSREDAYAPFADYNKELFELLTRSSCANGKSEAFLSQVGWMVERHLSGGRPSLDEVAAEMGMGRRSFQRMLSAAGTTFHKIVAGKRRLLAREYLKDPALSLGEISCLLGFDDQNSFSRSFRQWEGVSPNCWRSRH